MAPSHVFAGLARWPGGGSLVPPPGTLGGVFRLAVGGTEWEHMTSGLPEECHVPCLTVDPHDATRIYAGTQEGPYVSTDAGATWRRLDFPHRDLQVWSIAVHPRDPRRLFVGTSPLGLFRSEDGGGTWVEAPSARLPDAIAMGGFRNRVMRIAIDPARPEEMFAALEVRGVMRSTDGGETWQDASAHLLRLAATEPHLRSAILTKDEAEGMLDVHAVAISPAAPGSPFLALRMGLFRSDDGGAHWRDLELRRRSPIFYGRDIRVSPVESRTLFATLSVSSGGETGTVWRSPDLGANWARFDAPTQARSTMMAVAPSPRDARVVYAAARKGQVFGTLDGGETWRETPLPAGCIAVLALGIN